MEKKLYDDGFYSMPDHRYFKIDAVSNSGLMNFDKSPLHYLKGIAKTPSMERGSLIHAVMAGNKKEFDNQYLVCNYTTKATNQYKELKAANPYKTIIKPSELESAEKIRDYAMLYEIVPGYTIGKLYDKALKEKVLLYHDPEDMLLKKIKLDFFYYNEKLPIVIDWKKSKDCFKFMKSMSGYDYFRQNAFYVDLIEKFTGCKPLLFFFAIEDQEPYGMKSWSLRSDYIEFGRKKYQESIERLKAWKAKKIDPLPFHNGNTEIETPGYILKELKEYYNYQGE
jgi:hypothetical protein